MNNNRIKVYVKSTEIGTVANGKVPSIYWYEMPSNEVKVELNCEIVELFMPADTIAIWDSHGKAIEQIDNNKNLLLG